MDTSLKLLVIDDEELMLSLFEAVMAEHGHAVATARSGQEGVEIARTGQFDVVITDIRMPDMSGIEVLGAIRAHSDEVGVVLITGYASLETAIDALRLGADAYLLKPFEDFERDVLKVVERIAQKYGYRRENKRLTADLNEANEHLKRANLEYRRTLAFLNTQHQMASMLCNARDVESIGAIADQAFILGFETQAYALLLAAPEGRFELVRSSGLAFAQDGTVSVEAGSGPVGTALAQRRAAQLDLRQPGAEGREPWMPEGMACLVVPCVAAGEVVGALLVFDPDPGQLFATERVSLYTVLAAQIAAPLVLTRPGGAGAAPRASQSGVRAAS